jgi:imidazolonepropionase-like amidohydrolase
LLDGARLPWYGDLPLVLESPDEVDEALLALEARGVDFFKVYDQLSPEVFEAIAAYANVRGIPFAGHPPRSVGMARAAAAGQRSIEHLSVFTLGDCVVDPDDWFKRALDAKFGEGGYNAYFDVVLDFFMKTDWERCGKALETIAAEGTYFTPTLVMELNDREHVDMASLEYMTPDSRAWCETTLEAVAAAPEHKLRLVHGEFLGAARTLHDIGIPLLAGSDNPNYCLVPGFSLHSELVAMAKAGISSRAVLAAATVNAAAALGYADEFGVVAEGYRASFVLLVDDPLTDIRNTRNIRGVFVSGRWFGGAEIRALKYAARQAVVSD